MIEADESYCTGSRTICMSLRSQEILEWVGAGTFGTLKFVISRCRAVALSEAIALVGENKAPLFSATLSIEVLRMISQAERLTAT